MSWEISFNIELITEQIKWCTSSIQGLWGPAWNNNSRPPAPHASRFINVWTSFAHGCCVIKPWDAYKYIMKNNEMSPLITHNY